MTPEQQFDSLFQVIAPNKDPRTFTPPKMDKASLPKLARLQNLNARSLFVTFFGGGRADPTEYSGHSPGAAADELAQLNNAAALGLHGQGPGKSRRKTIEKLYLTALSRRPTAGRERINAYLPATRLRAHEGYADVLWALLNCSEFALNTDRIPLVLAATRGARGTIAPGSRLSGDRCHERIPTHDCSWNSNERPVAAGPPQAVGGRRRRRAMSGWLNVLAAGRPATGVKHKSCILLWMDGGPSHKDTFDLKPGTADGGEFKPIHTACPASRSASTSRKLAQLMKHAAILRGMSTGEGAHGRASYYMHTGYREGWAASSIPASAPSSSTELGQPEFPLPNFVAVAASAATAPASSAPQHQPLDRRRPRRGVENLKPLVDRRQFDDRVGLLEEMEQGFHRDYQADRRQRPPDHLSARRHPDAVQGGQGVRPAQEPAAVARSLRRPASSARAACWPAGWSRPASPSSR